jgi:tetratricopeptide (TPR) repeat protein
MDYLSLCLICKDENDYLSEWLDYHILMGVDRFYIYDNESQISLRKTLENYIERGWVVVVDIHGEAMQVYAYDHCLQTFGSQTFWMGFIDTDEFLVAKDVLDLKELLKDYESYGGLAISSLFFGSNGHQTRPDAGQIASYTQRTHSTFNENELVKSVVQPRLTLMPHSPHDFTFKETAYCVNESFLRVDFQRFPNYVEKIQLNHYYCRSEHEIDIKLQRGNSGSIAWPRKRFDAVNLMATYEDKKLLEILKKLFQKADIDSDGLDLKKLSLLEKMALLANARRPAPLEITPPCEANNFRVEFTIMEDLKSRLRGAEENRDFLQASELLLQMIERQPQYINQYIDLSINYLQLGNSEAAWQALSHAWQIAPNTYAVLVGMSFYFFKVKNYSMAEKTCQLILKIAPHNMMALGFLTEALIGQERFEEALKVGVPVVELSVQVGELPKGMDILLVKKMADYLLEKKDYKGAVRLWEAGVKCKPGDVQTLLELSHAMLLVGNVPGAQQRLVQAQNLAPQDERVIALLKQSDFSSSGQKTRK